MDWLYEERPFTENEFDSYGFVYYIEYECGKHYIGQKSFGRKTTLPARKNGIQRENSTRIQRRKPMTIEELAGRTKAQRRTNVKSKLVPYDVVIKENDWRTYEGSSDDVKDLVIKAKHIMHLCPTKRNLTYMETKLLFLNEVLEDENYVNKSILGTFHKGRLI